MKTGKRFIALMLSVFMALCVCITACSAEQNKNETEKVETETATETATTESEVAIVKETISADDAIVGIKSIGSVRYDGAIINTIVAEYSVDLTGAELSLEDFEVGNYIIWNAEKKVEVGDAETAGTPVKVYVNDKPEATDAPSGNGKYVIFEINTDFQLSSSTNYTQMMGADVLQTGTVNTDNYEITPGTEAKVNYTVVESVSMKGTPKIENIANEGEFEVKGTEMFEIHSVDGEGELAPFYAKNCFDEATGEYTDVTVPYSIYVPEDYDSSKKYALVIVIGSAGCASNDCMITLTNSRAAIDLTTDEIQEYAKEGGVDGLIVACPQVPEGLRSTRDNWTVSSAVSAHWQFLDWITEEYSIDMDHIYGTGQSMGGMQMLEMAAQRDNYFAALWAVGNQWGNNYNKEQEYEGKVYYATPADGEIVWTVDADGNPCDYQNWFYMISDDNILITNCVGDAFSSGTWQELAYLYNDTCGVTFPKVTWDPLELTVEEQNSQMEDLLAMDSGNGFYWSAFSGGGHTGTWVYGYQVTAGYKWLLTQNRQTEQSRAKLDLDKPFEFADEQVISDERIYGTMEDGTVVYYATAKEGCGTAGYNSPVFVKSGTPAKMPGWTVD